MKVKQVLLFVVAVIFMLGIIMLVFPTDGIRVSKNFTLYFPSFEEMFSSKGDYNIAANSIISVQKSLKIDMDSLGDDIDIEELKKTVTPFEFPENKTDALDMFFTKLSGLGATDRVRIMHYGDSQIEGDRITCDIRSKLQSRFGGVGLGLCLPVAIYAQFSVLQSNSDNWTRYSGFGIINKNVKHRKYGPMISFNRFAPLGDSIWVRPESKYSGWLEFNKSHLAYSNTTKFKNIVIYYGNSNENVNIVIKSNGEVIATDSLKKGDDLNIYKYSSGEYLDNVRFEFEGYDSPDFYAISLEDDYGVYVDNIALRGSSGDVFASSDAGLLAKSYANLGVDLFILEFGGNSVPYVNDEKSAKKMANYFKHHAMFLKSLVPDACIIVIGPSDMSIKLKDSYVTYPILEDVIRELKIVTKEIDGVYWDSYKAMGGKNSMPTWVNSIPPLASSDYVHFTPQGANLISNMFYNALMLEYQLYLKKAKNVKAK